MSRNVASFWNTRWAVIILNQKSFFAQRLGGRIKSSCFARPQKLRPVFDCLCGREKEKDFFFVRKVGATSYGIFRPSDWPTRLLFTKSKTVIRKEVAPRRNDLSFTQAEWLARTFPKLAKRRSILGQNCFWFRPFCEKGLCQRNLWLAPASWRKNNPSRRRRESEFIGEFIGENERNSVGVPTARPLLGWFSTAKFHSGVCIVPNSHLFPKQSEVMTSHAPRAKWLETALYARRKPHALASTPATPKEKTLLAFLIWRGWNFFWKRKGCFSFGVLPSKYSGSAWGFNADEVLAKLFFGERICQNFGSFVFEFGCRKWKRRGLGRNFPFAPLFSFGEIRAGNTKKLPKNSFTKLFNLCIIVVSRNYAIYHILYIIMLNNYKSNVK